MHSNVRGEEMKRLQQRLKLMTKSKPAYASSNVRRRGMEKSINVVSKVGKCLEKLGKGIARVWDAQQKCREETG